jgi:2-oxoglutarate/2-oxoacid ferredoxin oxidoreductase subunit alpha
VLAPTCVSDTFDVTVEAFNIAEEAQTPVVVLSDQDIAQRKEVIDAIDTSRFRIVKRLAPTAEELAGYERFRITESGISPISHPGMKGGNYLAAGIEHTEHGDPTASGALHERMTRKRFAKLEGLRRRKDLFRVEGDPEAPLALLSWGSTAGVCREARRILEGRGHEVKLLVPWLLWPIATGVYEDFFRSIQSGLVVEQSHQGQLYRVLRTELELPRGLRSYCRTGANPFQPNEIASALLASAELT